MDYSVQYDGEATHLTWQLEGVTARMIDWFWSNMEKGFMLWHPEEHEALEWPVPVKHGDLRGAIHNAPQTWGDGRRRNLYIRFEPLERLTASEHSLISHEHVIVAAGLGFSIQEMENDEPMGFRMHQWTKTDSGVIGKSSALSRRLKESESDGQVWAKHAAQEIGNWEVFLPTLHHLYRAVTDTTRNPFTDLSVAGTGGDARYINMR